MSLKYRVWWIPQIGGETFYKDVDSVIEGKKILDTLGDYDYFQYQNKIKPEYANVGGLEFLNSVKDEWIEWQDTETSQQIDEFTIEELKERYCFTYNS